MSKQHQSQSAPTPGESSPSQAPQPQSLVPTFSARPDLPTVWADHVRVVVARSGSTGLEVNMVLSFFHRLEVEGPAAMAFEASRVAMSPELARNMTNILCRVLDHYPTKESAAEQ